MILIFVHLLQYTVLHVNPKNNFMLYLAGI